MAWAQNPGLVAAYGFNEGSGTTVADSSGNGNTGTLVGATWTAAGKYGQALLFNGSARVTVPNAPSLQLTSGMTLEAWVNPSAVTSAWRDVIYKGNDNYYLSATSPSSSRPAAGSTFGNTFGTAVLPTNTWTHLAVTYDRAALRLFVNGVQVSALAATVALPTSTNPLEIGGDSIYGQFFQGAIDEVRIYNVALTAAQIQADMNAGAGSVPGPTNLVATVASLSEIDLSWEAPTSGSGVSGYRVERCQGVACSSFAQIAAPSGTGTTYADTGLAADTNYSYRVRAVDGAGNATGYSNVASAFTGLSISPRIAVVTSSQAQQFAASLSNVTWSVDGVVGGSAAIGTISAGGLYTPPSATGSHSVSATQGGGLSASATVYVSNYPGKYTHHNDNFRTGTNLNETVLTPNNVNSAIFGKLFSYPLDGLTLASPLYVANVNIPGKGLHNVVYVATEHNSVYAFDADGLSSSPLWQASFINPAGGVTAVPAADTGEAGDIPGEIGISGTPVIDSATGTLYVVAKTKEVVGPQTSYVQRLHALDIATGAEKFGGPVALQASVPGTGDGSQGGQVPFNALRENQRPALLLANGIVYIAFGSHGDVSPWHGWLLGYNATTLQQVFAFCVTPDSFGGGIWMSGGGPAVDANGSVYLATANGGFDASTGGVDLSDSYIKLSPTGGILDYFTPYDQATMSNLNHDLGSSNPMLLPDQGGTNPHLLVGAGKGQSMYLIDRDNMGQFHSGNDSQIVQSLVNIFPRGTPEPGNYIPPAYFNGVVYFSPVADKVQAFSLTNGRLSTSPVSQTAVSFPYPGGAMAISANGTSSGVLWVVQRNGVTAPGVLRAYDTSDLGTELYNSSQAGARDALDVGAKFTVPLIANGKVFVGSATQLTVYGFLP